jgi:hypothetical protein
LSPPLFSPPIVLQPLVAMPAAGSPGSTAATRFNPSDLLMAQLLAGPLPLSSLAAGNPRMGGPINGLAMKPVGVLPLPRPAAAAAVGPDLAPPDTGGVLSPASTGQE